ncbi:MAG: hypothetical protein AB7K86_14270 [Rhodospirillales bacterium]
MAVFAVSLWLVRSQATVSGASYMRAMIPHHSIAIMTGAGAVELNGIIVRVEGAAAAPEAEGSWRSEGLTMTVRPLGEQADWRADAELIFALERGPSIGCRGF